jgi:hypothetical protein
MKHVLEHAQMDSFIVPELVVAYISMVFDDFSFAFRGKSHKKVTQYMLEFRVFTHSRASPDRVTTLQAGIAQLGISILPLPGHPMQLEATSNGHWIPRMA